MKRANLRCVAGTDKSWYLTLKSTPLISGWTFQGQIRKSIGGDLIADFEFEILDESAGRVRMFLTNDVTENVPVSNVQTLGRDYIYEVRSTSNDGIITEELQGTITFYPAVIQ